MRLRCLLLVVGFTFAACCYGLAKADDTALIKNSKLDSSRVVVSDDNVKRYLKSSKTTKLEGEERAFMGFTSLKTLSNKFPHLDKLKTLIKENPAVSKAKLVVSKHLPLQGVVAILKGELKPMVIIAAVALTGGYIVYLVKD